MSLKLFACQGGDISLPEKEMVLVSREDGGNLIVNPPREVWERSELSAEELKLWGYLVAATGRAMLDVLPQLEDGCINYWEAGNWALNIDAEPAGVTKTGTEHRKVHLHLLGRNPRSTNPSLTWGEAPNFPTFRDRLAWASHHERLSPGECTQIVELAEQLLRTKYWVESEQIKPWQACVDCGYPTVADGTGRIRCDECSMQFGRI